MTENKTMSVGDWMLTLLLASIPLVGVVMLFVWAFGDSTNLSKKNWAKATLIFLAILLVLYLILGFVILGALAASF